EIDILNMRNLFRLRAGSWIADVAASMIPGCNLPVDEFVRIAGIAGRDAFIAEFEKTEILPGATRAVGARRQEAAMGPEKVADRLGARWEEHRTTVHVVEVAVTRVRLEAVDRITTRHPFSVLPSISCLGQNRIEVGNLRACVR